MRTLFTAILILCAGCSSNSATVVEDNNQILMDSKQKSLIILQRKAMKKLYPKEVLKDWKNDVNNCLVVAKADSLYDELLQRAVNAEESAYLVVPSHDDSEEPIIRTRIK